MRHDRPRPALPIVTRPHPSQDRYKIEGLGEFSFMDAVRAIAGLGVISDRRLALLRFCVNHDAPWTAFGALHRLGGGSVRAMARKLIDAGLLHGQKGDARISFRVTRLGRFVVAEIDKAEAAANG